MVQNENSYMMNLVRCAHNWNDGMLEYWNNGMAPFGQINAYGGNNLPGAIGCQGFIFNKTFFLTLCLCVLVAIFIAASHTPSGKKFQLSHQKKSASLLTKG
jgi:hypothetical protein